MTVRSAVSTLAIVLLICGLCAIAGGQTRVSGPTKIFPRIPGALQRHVEALGIRVQQKGRERVVYTGEFSNAAGASLAARVTVQLPRMVRLEGFKDRILTFDGERAKNATARLDTALLETFLLDTPEGMLESIQGVASMRLLGRDFGPDPLANPDYAGPRYDIYDVVMPDLLGKESSLQSRQYYFDSTTHLLQSTQYYDRTVSPPIKVETRFSMWGVLEGSAYPACIERFENGKLVFSFIATGIESGSALDLSNYR